MPTRIILLKKGFKMMHYEMDFNLSTGIYWGEIASKHVNMFIELLRNSQLKNRK